MLIHSTSGFQQDAHNVQSASFEWEIVGFQESINGDCLVKRFDSTKPNNPHKN
jgi:hypothetical protein